MMKRYLFVALLALSFCVLEFTPVVYAEAPAQTEQQTIESKSIFDSLASDSLMDKATIVLGIIAGGIAIHASNKQRKKL